MRFTPSLIERLRSHFLMSEVVGRRMTLKKHGKEYQGLCPFHNEKSPSFKVHDDKGFYHCFGCGAHGSQIDFVMKFDKVSYPEAVESLAREAGITISEPTPAQTQKIAEQKTLYEVMEAACVWFEKNFVASVGMLAKDYVEKRGIRPDTIQRFRIGYAPDERNALHKHLSKTGFSQKLQAEAGLIIEADSGIIYDRFQARLIFPIRNASGKVVAFGGRILTNDKTKAKYLNSPETPLFKKGEMLYNLDLAKRPARDANMVVVMEGYMDVVMVAQSGVDYGVATLGTAVTPEHLRLLWQLAKEPVLCLDSDSAGKKAMLRSSETALPLLKPSFSLRYAVLPQGEDPDSYIQKQGKISFEKILLASKRLSQVLWDNLASGYKLDLPEGRAALDDACQKLSAKIADTTVRQHYTTYFRKELWSVGGAKVKLPKQNTNTKTPFGQKATPNQAKTRSPHIELMMAQHHSSPLEIIIDRLLTTLVQCPVLLHKSTIEEVISRLDIKNHKLDMLRNLLLMANNSVDIDNYELWKDYIKQQLPDIADSEMLNINDANLLWNETLATYEIAHLEYEYKQAEENMLTEADYLRFSELQNNLKKVRENRRFAPEEIDVA